MHALASELEPEDHPHDIPRLGDTTEFRSLLYRLVELAGWHVDTFPALGGGVLVFACKRGQVIARHGATESDVAVPIFKEAMGRDGRG